MSIFDSDEQGEHNRGQEAGANASAFDLANIEHNPFLSAEYKEGARHAYDFKEGQKEGQGAGFLDELYHGLGPSRSTEYDSGFHNGLDNKPSSHGGGNSTTEPTGNSASIGTGSISSNSGSFGYSSGSSYSDNDSYSSTSSSRNPPAKSSSRRSGGGMGAWPLLILVMGAIAGMFALWQGHHSTSGDISVPSIGVDSDLSNHRVVEADLTGKSVSELDLMRNGIYAHHGMKFSRTELSRYFGLKNWYHPVTRDQDVVWRHLSKIERYDAAFIRRFEADHGMVQTSASHSGVVLHSTRRSARSRHRRRFF